MSPIAPAAPVDNSRVNTFVYYIQWLDPRCTVQRVDPGGRLGLGAALLRLGFGLALGGRVEAEGLGGLDLGSQLAEVQGSTGHDLVSSAGR